MGKAYVNKYNKRVQKHKKAQHKKRKQLQELLDQIEGMVGILNTDQAAMHIHWLDLDLVGDDGQQMDEKVIKRQIEKQMDQLHKQEAAQNENYK